MRNLFTKILLGILKQTLLTNWIVTTYNKNNSVGHALTALKLFSEVKRLNIALHRKSLGK
ncbi:hypothetical protein EFY79_04595 [Hanamia caeni]|jgi:hypothetical protein|uniref:Uncharacterized protein n=1 Tax=Hanamia caeni TaxID=2294116 RepID=A0A3M9NP45_9BACT|nr:hypothetical protein EFY79_04595 [Hanamia caeni]